MKRSDLDRRARAEFEKLTQEEVEKAVRNLASSGFGEHSIAAATRLSLEQVRQISANQKLT